MHAGIGAKGLAAFVVFSVPQKCARVLAASTTRHMLPDIRPAGGQRFCLLVPPCSHPLATAGSSSQPAVAPLGQRCLLGRQQQWQAGDQLSRLLHQLCHPSVWLEFFLQLYSDLGRDAAVSSRTFLVAITPLLSVRVNCWVVGGGHPDGALIESPCPALPTLRAFLPMQHLRCARQR